MKIYVPQKQGVQVGGGFTFVRNFTKYARRVAHIVDSWQEADVVLVSGVTMVDMGELYEARKAGKGIYFRVDNVPRKSRNRRNTPHERMREIAGMADVVIYQSEWAKEYCKPITGEGVVIYNGVDTELFTPPKTTPPERYLYAYYGKNEQKQFWTAHLLYQYYHRKNPQAEFHFVYNFKNELGELSEANFDFWNGETYKYHMPTDNPDDMVELMQSCKYLIYPAVADAAPNTILEARACGLQILDVAPKELAGCYEYAFGNFDISAERMVQEYLGVMSLQVHELVS